MKIYPTNLYTPKFADLRGESLDIGEVGCTPLHLAIARGEYDVFKLLKSRGADILFRDKSGLVPLHRTVQAGRSGTSLHIIQSLLDEGVDVDIRDSRRQETTLLMAARLGKEDCVEYLLERGADIGATNHLGEHALQLARAGGHVEAARALLEHGMRRPVSDEGSEGTLIEE